MSLPAPRPFIHLNVAVTCEGSMTSEKGSVRSISSKADWHRVHRLRERYTAIAVGARTWNLDAPQLTARREHLGRDPHRQPDRVIFAGSQPCVIPSDGRRTFVVGVAEVAEANAIVIPTVDHRLARPLAVLAQHGVASMLVEGGATLLHSFIAQHSFDRITVFVRTDRVEVASASAEAVLAGLPATMEAQALEGGLLLAYRPTDRDHRDEGVSVRWHRPGS